MPFKTPLEAAIAHLISQGIIKGSADVARDLGMKSRSTISSYASGKLPISFKFRTLFEQKYNIQLKNFEKMNANSNHIPPNVVKPDDADYKEKYITLLERQLEEKDRLIHDKNEHITVLRNHINSSVSELQRQQVELQKAMVINRGYGKGILMVLERILHNQEPKKSMEKIRSDVDTLLAEGIAGAS